MRNPSNKEQLMTEHATQGPVAAGATSPHVNRDYLPGMGHDWLLPVYDPLTRLLGARSAHRQLAGHADLRPGQRVLEIGCGTGNLALLVKRLRPDVEVVALDPDPRALARAGRKARRAGLPVRFDRGFAEELPYPDASFDRILSAFMFHHLEPTRREDALREVSRALRPGGSLHLLDFGGTGEGSHGLLARRLHRSPRFRDNVGDRIPALMRGAGLSDPVETGQRVTHLGRYTIYLATRGTP
jgi:SAM-dependent methyltransferase